MATPTPPDPAPDPNGTPSRPPAEGPTGTPESAGPGGSSAARQRPAGAGAPGGSSSSRQRAADAGPGAPSGGTRSSGASDAAGTGTGDGDATQPKGAPPVPFTQQLGRVTIVVLAVLFGVFAVVNSQRVDFSWIVGETIVREGPTGEVTGGVPLIVLLLGAFLAGAVIAVLTELYVARARRARQASADPGKGKRKGGRKDEGGRS